MFNPYAYIVSAALWAVIIFCLTGCGSTTGWNVSFGVTPITAVDNQQKLIGANRGAIIPADDKRRY